MGLAVGTILCAIAVYSLIALMAVADTMRAVDIIITAGTQLVFLAIGGYLIKSSVTRRKK